MSDVIDIDHVQFPQLRTAFVDDKGFINIEWRNLLNEMWTNAGGGEVATTTKNIIPPAVLGTSIASLYTSSSRTRLDKVTVSNPTAGAQTVSIYLVPSGSSPDATTEIVPALSIAAGASVEITTIEGQCLEKGATFQASADAASALVLMVTGVQITS